MNIKEFRNKFIDFLKMKCDNSKISNKTLGIYIRAFHICAPFNILAAMFILDKILCNFIILFLFIAFTFYILFNGCFITMLERKLCDDNITFIDPLLEYYDLELSKKERNRMSIKVAAIYIILVILIYIFRFYLFNKYLENLKYQYSL